MSAKVVKSSTLVGALPCAQAWPARAPAGIAAASAAPVLSSARRPGARWFVVDIDRSFHQRFKCEPAPMMTTALLASPSSTPYFPLSDRGSFAHRAMLSSRGIAAADRCLLSVCFTVVIVCHMLAVVRAGWTERHGAGPRHRCRRPDRRTRRRGAVCRAGPEDGGGDLAR